MGAPPEQTIAAPGYGYTGPPEFIRPEDLTQLPPAPYGYPPSYPAPSYPAPSYPAPPYPAYPSYPQSGYAPSTYPPPGWPQPSGQPWVPTPPQPFKKRWIALIVAAAVVAVGGVTTAAVLATHSGTDSGKHGPARALGTPETAGGYVRLHTSAATNIESRVQDEILSGSSFATAALKNARVGVYAQTADADPAAIFLGVDAADSSSAASQLHGESDVNKVLDVLTGANAQGDAVHDAGPLGGSLQCGTTDVASASVAVCAWSDYSTLGMVIFNDQSSTAEAATFTLALRTAAEH